MHNELVDKRRWIDEQTFLRGLNFCMLLPGPEAMQLATWLGWRVHGLRGGIAAGALFVLPAAVLMVLLSWLYLRYQSVPLMTGVVFGLQAAVLGIIVHAAQRIGGRVLKTPFAIALAVIALLAIALLRVPFPLLLLIAALSGLAVWRYRPTWLPGSDSTDAKPAEHAHLPRADIWRAVRIAGVCLLLWWLPILGLGAWLGHDSTAFAMGAFFSKTALVTLGGAYAVLPYVATQAVEGYGWLEPAQMMTGLGLAETTPGPLILVLEFVGFAGGWQHPGSCDALGVGPARCRGDAVGDLPAELPVRTDCRAVDRTHWPLATCQRDVGRSHRRGGRRDRASGAVVRLALAGGADVAGHRAGAGDGGARLSRPVALALAGRRDRTGSGRGRRIDAGLHRDCGLGGRVWSGRRDRDARIPGLFQRTDKEQMHGRWR